MITEQTARSQPTVADDQLLPQLVAHLREHRARAARGVGLGGSMRPTCSRR